PHRRGPAARHRDVALRRNRRALLKGDCRRPFKGGYFTIAAVPWYVHNALFYLVRFAFLPFVTTTPFGIGFLRRPGLRIGRRGGSTCGSPTVSGGRSASKAEGGRQRPRPLLRPDLRDEAAGLPFGRAFGSVALRPGSDRLIQASAPSRSWSHGAAPLSDGARQSLRGDSEPPEPTFGAFGSAERLNWLWRKNRSRKTPSQRAI